MPANVEIKARVRDHQGFLARAIELADSRPEIIQQKDTFFQVPSGRLKLRDFGDGTGELIRYQRPDAAGPKVSDYAISRTGDPEGLASLLGGCLPMIGVVAKTRTLLLAGRTRIHLDQVDGLGWYMELEVVLDEGEPPAAGHEEARRLMTDLGIAPEDLVQGAYLDLLQGDRPG
jgi:adenylate cyclase class IV